MVRNRKKMQETKIFMSKLNETTIQVMLFEHIKIYSVPF